MNEDKYLKFGEYRGYEYCVRCTYCGTVCCYINVQQNAYARAAFSKYEKGSELDYGLFDVHGGVTYFQRGLSFLDSCSCTGWKDDIVVGCDYAHFGDTKPGVLNIMVSLISEEAAEIETKTTIDGILENFDL